ncbi:MAG: LapA family protein [Actinomycetota bacterium]|nr:LapA family protein [Actinomycetota bacterium]
MLLVVMLVFITQNRRSTTVRFLIPETTAPLWVALFVSALLGMVVGGLLARRR